MSLDDIRSVDICRLAIILVLRGSQNALQEMACVTVRRLVDEIREADVHAVRQKPAPLGRTDPFFVVEVVVFAAGGDEPVQDLHTPFDAGLDVVEWDNDVTIRISFRPRFVAQPVARFGHIVFGVAVREVLSIGAFGVTRGRELENHILWIHFIVRG